jgi:hypothetical protein
VGVVVSPRNLVSTQGFPGNSSSLSSTATTGPVVKRGDLVIFACDLAASSGNITVLAPPGMFDPPQQVGPVVGNGAMDVAAWGIVKELPDAGTITMYVRVNPSIDASDSALLPHEGPVLHRRRHDSPSRSRSPRVGRSSGR